MLREKSIVVGSGCSSKVRNVRWSRALIDGNRSVKSVSTPRGVRRNRRRMAGL